MDTKESCWWIVPNTSRFASVFILTRYYPHLPSQSPPLFQDKNKDGLFSVDELNEWLKIYKLVKLVNEGDHVEAYNLISERLNDEEAAHVKKINADMLATNAKKLHVEEAVNAKKLDTEQQPGRNRGKDAG